MLLTTTIEGLAAYFRHSALFYYFTTDLQGNYTYVNPLFQHSFQHIASDFYAIPAVDTFIAADRDRYKKAVHQCLENPNNRVSAELQILLADGSIARIRWEFSKVATGDKADSIQVVGVLLEGPAALTEIEKLFRSQSIILNNVTDTIVTTDLERKVTSWNKVAEKITGITAEQALGKRTQDILDTSYAPYTHDQVAEIVFREGIWRGEMSFTGNDGERKHFLHTVSMLYDEKGEKLGLLGVGKEITERKKTEDRLKESEQHFRDLIYNLNQGVIMVNSKAEVIGCNFAAQSILGITEEELIGMVASDPNWKAIHEDGRDFSESTYPVWVAMLNKKPVRNVVMGFMKAVTKERIWLLVNADPTLDSNGNILYIVVSFTDITEQRRLSQQLIDQEIQKQKQLTQATIDGQEKERQEIGKELHDNINQHLTTTRLYLEVAKEQASGPVLEMIRLSHKMLVGIINEIRRLSQSLVPPTLGDIGLVESIQDLCDSLKRAHTFTIEFFHRHFYEDRLPSNMKLMIFRIIQEQISNIIRHAQASQVQIRLQSDAENITLSIFDNGKGFNMNDYKKGLGISNIFNRVSLFNGKMEIEAAPGKGCKLTIIIPLLTMNGVTSDE